MKIFLDTADIDAVRKAHATGLLDGVTTNPSHIAKAGRVFEEVIREMCTVVAEHVSVEAVADNTDGLVMEARRLAAFGPQVVVKIPMTREGLRAVPILEREHRIRTNVTMVFSPTQALLAMKAGASFVSIVLSRLENVAIESDRLINDTMAIKRQYGFKSEIIAGSLKTQPTLLSCLRAGVDIGTMPEDLFNQMFQHPLTELGLAQFDRDWQKVKKEARAAG
ncbi:MAG TPA: transaldolase family protein [Acidobacteriota bacterium]|nr:transaldolase family protein [Acidobacteriota bacterium]